MIIVAVLMSVPAVFLFTKSNQKGKVQTLSRLDSDAKVDYTEELPDLRSDILGAILDLSSELENRYIIFY